MPTVLWPALLTFAICTPIASSESSGILLEDQLSETVSASTMGVGNWKVVNYDCRCPDAKQIDGISFSGGCLRHLEGQDKMHGGFWDNHKKACYIAPTCNVCESVYGSSNIQVWGSSEKALKAKEKEKAEKAKEKAKKSEKALKAKEKEKAEKAKEKAKKAKKALIIGKIPASSGKYAGRLVYGIPIQGDATNANSLAACVSKGLHWVHFQNDGSCDAWCKQNNVVQLKFSTECSSQTQRAIMKLFCGGSCNASAMRAPKCSNLATYNGAGGKPCTNPRGGQYCAQDWSNMKSLCIEPA